MLIISFSINGQSYFITSSDGVITIENGATIYVDGNINMGQNSLFKNSGNIRLTKNWINNSSSSGFDQSILYGNVHFIGGNQLIDGTNSTNFYNIHLYGDYTIKECMLNTFIEGRLHLNNSELQTHQNIVSINNPNSNAITFEKGYVASDLLGGYLMRKTNSINDYYFPTGNSIIDFYKRLRPVTISPVNNSENYFAVRLAPLYVNNDIGTSITGAIAPYPVQQKQAELNDFNTLFYHNIARVQGNSPAKIDIWYEEEDGEYNTIAHWNSQETWIDEQFNIQTFSSPTISNFPLNKASFINFNNFNHDAFVLANKINLNNIYIPNSFTPNGDHNNDIFIPILNYDNIDEYELVIYDRWGKQLFFTDNVTEGWDGTSLNQKVQLGTYIWTLRIKPSETNANFIEKIGHINLIR
ncbi:MAG: gliding motility-associated C-terminal domain-containing protein [Flavobacteriales bacterium]|nr:gliding motility-associated C-terminal domain-containing protein [Flavobacteriales bacterium]